MPTPCETPPVLPARAQSVAELTGHWCVARVRPRSVKLVVRGLMERGESWWLPLKREKKYRSCGNNRQRKYYIDHPVYENFLFACFNDPWDVFSLYDFPGHPVFGILDVCQSAQAAFVKWCVAREHELSTEGKVKETPGWLREGAFCRIASGAQCGFEGRVKRISNRGRKVLMCGADGELVEADLAEATLEAA